MQPVARAPPTNGRTITALPLDKPTHPDPPQAGSTALPTGAGTRLLRRDDIVLDKGRYTLVNRTTTPHEAMVEDLLFVSDALAAAGIEHLLVRGTGRRPVLAVDWKHRKVLHAALTEACADEPFYLKAVDVRRSEAVLVADGPAVRSPRSRIMRVHRPRIEPTGALRFGGATAVQIELWSTRGDTLTLPTENSLTRRTIPRHEAVRGTVERYGRTWTTIEAMFADHHGDIGFDIDLVFSWVDGSDDEWQKARAARMKSYVVGDGDDSVARFRQVDELRYALRSVHLFAPWVRRIFVATDSPKPAWLADDPRVTFVRSEEFFTDVSVLPTHSSHAVEAQLHHIDGLAEHFLYSNDDMFFGRAVEPSMFFSPGGITKFIEATTRIGLGANDPARSGFENASRVNRALLLDRFGLLITRHLEHAPAPLRKSVLVELEQTFADEFRATTASRFRSSTDISVTNSLYHYYALMTGRAVVQDAARTTYIDTTARAGLADMQRLLAARDADMFCLNDGSFPEVDPEVRARAVTEFLTRYFPIPAPWERLTPPPPAMPA